MALPTPVLIEDSSITSWEWIGSGGFGEIYKAKHPHWDYEVAIKLLRNDGGTSSLMREVRMMLQGSSEYVMQVLGVFMGRSPKSGPSEQLGLVMKYMEKGSLESLQKTLDGVAPLPLVFRLAHQVALGINFLHSLSKALLHHDLKPNNVLLDSDLNVKLTDFGLSKASQTQAQVTKTDLEDKEGTISYMPPEAFGLNYKPSRAFDIYSYGILLWSIATGEQPYAHAPPSAVILQIPRGQRPSLDELSIRAADQEELRGLVELMVKCWGGSPTERPSSLDCTKITEELYERHEHGINEAVHEVLKKLEQKEQDKLTEDLQWLRFTPASGAPKDEAVKNLDHVKTGPPPVQEVAPKRSPNQRVKDPPASRQANMCEVDSTRSSTDDHKPKASSVHPIGESPAPPSTTRSPQASAAKNPPQLFQRQFSSPTPSSTIQPTHYVCIHCGKENTLIINKEPLERKQHPTAPSRVNPPSTHPGSSKNM
ncbi:receptor-interacting serine/threonine-protein kinase 3-like [Limanda limanda]|uniref:receptor-interacting serine/threonine-protein kinase 3-like n=1 Tax=Limanda limanda TaxID=27771 RepID=UPI0029C7A838|nr:receptor-interacting serine/threonine-protein kinase 3-like [Limanda limanda]